MDFEKMKWSATLGRILLILLSSNIKSLGVMILWFSHNFGMGIMALISNEITIIWT